MKQKQRNILMCLQKLDIGGVETAVLTLCSGYIRKGYNVFVAAEEGIFLPQLEKMGVKVLNIKYEFLNRFALERQEELCNFCIENNITEIHIHQYPCVLYWLPVCAKLNIPYVAYVHSIVPGAPQWFMKDFKVHRVALPIFFEKASKIVCIAESTKNEIEELFHIGEEHYKIIPNSLNMEDFKEGKVPEKINKFGLVSRISEEKMLSLKNSIDLFSKYLEFNPDSELLIAGDGPLKKELESYSKNIKNIKFLGPISDVSSFLGQIDVFMGVDRCILEALACKRLAIISSYNGNMNILNKNNIEKATKQNFSGNNLDNQDNILECIKNITPKEYKKIVNENYLYIDKYYNVDNNLYMYELDSNFTNDYEVIFSRINEFLEELDNKNYEISLLKEKNKPILKRMYNKIYNAMRKIYHKIFK